MNGETAQISNIVMSARKAIYVNKEIQYVVEKYVKTIKFTFLARGIISKNQETASSVNEWFDISRKHGLKDIKFLIPTEVTNRYVLGFSNTGQGIIVCFWKNASVTYFTAKWEFNRENTAWEVFYEEHEWNDAPEGKPEFNNGIEEFKQVLLDIEGLAEKIQARNFAKIFHRAYELLCGNLADEASEIYPDIPEPYKNIYRALSVADVFGAMGSWNDDPEGMAGEKGLKKEYDELSDKLLKQIRYNLMYVTNECWK